MAAARRHSSATHPIFSPQLWDLRTGKCLRKFCGHTDGVTFVMPGPDGRVLTASEDRTIRMWDVETGECARVIRSHSGAVTGLCMASADRIVTGATDKKLRVFDPSGNICGEAELDSEIMAVASPLPPPATGPRRALQYPKPVAGPSAGGSAASASARSTAADAGPSEAAGAAAAGKEPSAAAPSRIRVFACGGAQVPAPIKPMLRRLEVNPRTTDTAVATGGSSRPNMCTSCAEEADGEAGVVTSMAIAAAGSRGRGTLVTGSYDKGVRVLRNVLCPGARVAGGPSQSSSSEDDDADEQERSQPAGPGVSMELLGRHSEGVRCVAVSADGRWAASGCRGGRINVWEISPESRAQGTDPSPPLGNIEGHAGVVFSLCMSPDARVLVSAGSDRHVRVWDLALIVYARRLVLNRCRGLWSAGRVRGVRPKRTRMSSSPTSGSGPSGSAMPASKAFRGLREQRQLILEGLFALPDIIYAKVLMYL